MTYDVTYLTVRGVLTTDLTLTLDPTGLTVFNKANFKLHVGDTVLSFDDATTSATSFQWTMSGLSWPDGQSDGDMIAVKITDSSIANNDATLSDLELEDASDDSSIALDQTFAADTTSYTASVANRVTQVTIEASPNDDGADVEYQDSSDAALTDANSTKDGFQIDLLVGANVIKAEVTAEDDSTTETYQVTVTRAAAAQPSISTTTGGMTRVGDTLRVDPSTITDPDGVTMATYSYQWIRVATGGTETDISGETGEEYTLAAADQGLTIKVRASFTDDGGNPETRTSDASATVAAQPSNGCAPDTVQLVSGSVASEGSLQYCRNNQWRSVCDDKWNKQGADVACRQARLSGGRESRHPGIHQGIDLRFPH